MKAKSLNTAEVLKNSTYTAQAVRENIEDFTSYGYSIDDVTTLETLITDFKTELPDSYFVELNSGITAQKTQLRKEIAITVSNLVFRLKCSKVPGAKTSRSIKMHVFIKLGNAGFEKEVSDFLVKLDSNVSYLQALSTSTDLILQVRTKLALLSNLDLDSKAALTQRKISTNSRNALFGQIRLLASELNSAGKKIYKNIDSAKYDRYVVYSKNLQNSSEVSYIVEPINVAA